MPTTGKERAGDVVVEGAAAGAGDDGAAGRAPLAGLERRARGFRVTTAAQ
jgi:hypothetical protein